ncbi:hypothetical protein [Clostridium culturomicium]|uniref:hypothetical protein n=1 Tax=Clostridium culturomicium TaxID=1499683 RepID=UPI000B288123|nr:hypothetical protein [Clostridium culturomicium]
MKYCVNCHSRFTLLYRIKSLFKKNGQLECTNCHRFCMVKKNINFIVNFTIIFISAYLASIIGDYWLINLSMSTLATSICKAVMAMVICLLLGIPTALWIPYDVVDKK